MQQQKILSVGPLPEWVRDEFFSPFEVNAVKDSSRSAVLSSLDVRVVAIISRGPVLIDAQVMDAAPSLKAIARTGVGLDTVDVEAASLRNIPGKVGILARPQLQCPPACRSPFPIPVLPDRSRLATSPGALKSGSQA